MLKMPHASHGNEAKLALAISGLLLLLFLVVANINWPRSDFLDQHFAVLHLAIETTAIAVATMTFGVVWSLRFEKPSQSLVLLACAFLGVAILNFSHMLSYADMPDFITPGSRQKSIFFWLSAHALGSILLFIIALKPIRSYNPKYKFRIILPITIAIVIAIHLYYFLVVDETTGTYLVNNKITDLKRNLEYSLIIINFITALLFLRLMYRQRYFNASGLFAATFVLGLGEYFYTLYGATTDVYNLFGHLYKLIGFALLYWAVFVETLRNPYIQLRQSRRQLRATMLAMPDLVFEINEHYIFVNFYASKHDGLYMPESDFMGKSIFEVFPPDICETHLKFFSEIRKSGIARGYVICLSINNEDHWFEMSGALKPANQDTDAHYIVISRDITERRESGLVLQTLSSAIMQSPIAFVITDINHRIEACNQAYANISSSTIEELIGESLFDLPVTRSYGQFNHSIKTRLREGKSWHGELTRIDKNGNELILDTQIFAVLNDNGEITNHFAYLDDVTEKKMAIRRIRHLSQYDQLTGLPNRALLQRHFENLASGEVKLAVFWIDLDNFKDINDSLGHQIGDILLREIAHRLRQQFDFESMLTRLSGDDFLVVMPFKNSSQVAAKASEINQLVSMPTHLLEQELSVTASIGIAIYPEDATDFDSLLKNAESAMYIAKSAGRNNNFFYTPEMQLNSTRLLELSSSLKQVLGRGELRLVYQPQVCISGEHIIGAEALLRWHSDKWGEVSPAEFIPIAESTGMMIAIGDWVLRTAVEQIHKWREQGIYDLTISVNLSALQFNLPDLAQRITSLLHEFDVPATSLALEITEAVAMANPEDAANKIHQLQQQNINFAIDDFGTGYSSLSYLKRFKVKKIKIDQSFIRDIHHNDEDQAITDAIIQMARKLGIKTIAEGVETQDQLDLLKTIGCDDIQGFYYSKPLEAQDFAAFIENRDGPNG